MRHHPHTPEQIEARHQAISKATPAAPLEASPEIAR